MKKPKSIEPNFEMKPKKKHEEPESAEERKTSWSKYIFAIGLTALIIVATITTYLVADTTRVKELNLQSEIIKTDYESLQVQQLYLTTIPNTNESCPALKIALQESIKKLAGSLDNVKSARDSTIINEKEMTNIERKYLNDNIRYWLFAKKTKELCGTDTAIIIFFTTTRNCDECEKQGAILTYYKKKLQDQILIFPLNTALEEDEAIIKILKMQYGVTTLPAIIVENDVYNRIVEREELREILKNKYYDTTKISEE